jgi:hypothetical protein
MRTETFDRAQVVLSRRYPTPDEGQTVRYRGTVWRRVGDEWLIDSSRVGVVLARLEEADGLWASASAKRLGMRIVRELLTAAWKQADE